ncbi:MAG: biotin transporter BioY [Lachnospiraceae bacterium]|nr:biotin transporter BioY [Lachnospiraceae bacterium]
MVMARRKMKTIDLAYMALGAVIIAVCSWISVPTTVPFTMQTFAVFCILGLLGGKRGTISILVYILLGAVGVPVFAGFSGGFGIIIGPTGGYIVAFVLMGLLYWLIEVLFGTKLYIRIIAMLAGLLVCYAFGTAWFMVVYARQTGPMSLGAALASCVVPFIVPDLIKMALALLITSRVGKYLK